MIDQLQNKKDIFFDVGYTLDMPASGDWMFTKRFLEEAGDTLKRRGSDEIGRARDAGLRYLGVFKPDPRMYQDALAKGGVPAEDTVFIDDSVHNLDSAAALGVLPILIAAHPASDVETSYLKIRDLREVAD